MYYYKLNYYFNYTNLKITSINLRDYFPEGVNETTRKDMLNILFDYKRDETIDENNLKETIDKMFSKQNEETRNSIFLFIKDALTQSKNLGGAMDESNIVKPSTALRTHILLDNSIS
jgi:hypothetical protein